MNENQTTDDSIIVDDITVNQSGGDVPQHFMVEGDLPSFARHTERADRVVALQVEDDSLGQYNAKQKCSDREEEPSEEKKSLGLENDQTGVLGESRLPETNPGEDEDEDGRQAAQQ